MDPVRGSGPKPVGVTVSGGGAVEGGSAESPDGPSGTPDTGVYRGEGGRRASRADWPALPDPGKGSFGEATVDRCAAEIAKLEAELEKLGDGPEAMAKMMKLQRQLDTYTRIMSLVSEIWKSRSDAINRVINNIN